MAIQILNNTYYNILESESNNTSVFDGRESTSTITYVISQSQIISFINDVLGHAELKNNTFISRSIPASHPLFPWQYAYKVESIKGYRPDGKKVSSELKALTTFKNIDVDEPYFSGSYDTYKIVVRYVSRDYNVYDDKQLEPYYSTRFYYLPFRNANDDWSEKIESYRNRKEHWRFVNTKMTPSVELLNYGGGNFWAKRQAGLPQDEAKEFPISMENNGINNIKITKHNLDVNWFFVPFELTVNNSIWTEAYGKVNLYPFLDYPKGTLLFKDVTVRKYEPYYPFSTIDIGPNSSVYDFYTEYNKNQYCDITFKFVYFTLPTGVITIPDPATYAFLQCKDVRSEHNLLVNPKNLQWYYVESSPQIAGNPANKKAAPIYWNYDHEHLFYYTEG